MSASRDPCPTARRILKATNAQPLPACPVLFATQLPDEDALLALAFRHWVSGYQTGDITAWERCWNVTEVACGAAQTAQVVGALGGFVRAARAAAQRHFEVLPSDCPGFCRDECATVALVAACQYNACPVLRICGEALLGTPAFGTPQSDAVLGAAAILGGTLSDAGHMLSPKPVYGRNPPSKPERRAPTRQAARARKALN